MAYASDDSMSAAGEVVQATRKGDDDPRPRRPPAEVMKRTLEMREKALREIEETQVADQTNAGDDGDQPAGSAETEPSSGPIKKFAVCLCVSLLVLWSVHALCSLIGKIMTARTTSEIVLACVWPAAVLGVVLFVVIYARRLFGRLPSIESIKRKDFGYDTKKLKDTIQHGYLDLLPTPEDYAAQLRLEPTHDLPAKLAKLKNHDYTGSGSRAFLQDFTTFQSLQEERAAEVIKKYAKLIAVKTAASPWRIVDMLAVFYNSTLMICEIAKIYNRRVSRPQAFNMVLKWMFNLYVSGELGRVMDYSAEVLNSKLENLLGENGLSGIVQSALPLFTKFVGKVAEGGINAYLAYRLGKCSVANFRYMK